jgi:hypothetical protein
VKKKMDKSLQEQYDALIQGTGADLTMEEFGDLKDEEVELFKTMYFAKDNLKKVARCNRLWRELQQRTYHLLIMFISFMYVVTLVMMPCNGCLSDMSLTKLFAFSFPSHCSCSNSR